MDEVELPRKEISKQDEYEEKQPTAKKQERVSFLRLFAAADKIDYILMFIGSIGSCLQGATLPVFFLVFGRLIDSLGSLSTDPHSFSSEVSKVHH